MKTNKQKVILYAVILASILAVAVLGSICVNLGRVWFSGLNRPSQFVPDFIIPIVWTIVYSLFAIVLCVWASKDDISNKTKLMLIVNAVLNVLWCLCFFALNQTLGGLIFILLLLIASCLLFVEINRHKPRYSYILSLYPIWVSIATCLNLAIWILN